jgi:hypothetical protein
MTPHDCNSGACGRIGEARPVFGEGPKLRQKSRRIARKAAWRHEDPTIFIKIALKETPNPL